MTRRFALVCVLLLVLLPVIPPSAAFAGPGSASIGGPDAFGYTWDDSEPFAWIDATAGTRANLVGDEMCAGPINLPFAFPFYENTYSAVYFNTDGLLRFGSSVCEYVKNAPFPEFSAPNDVIAALWADLNVPPTGAGVYFRSGGVSPQQWFAVQYQSVRRYEAADPLTFEVVLHENGDVVFQYQDVNGSGPETAGIEDETGWVGLGYPGALQDGLAVRFTRPPGAPRARLAPPSGAALLQPWDTATYTVTVANTGSSGPDTFDLTLSAPWQAALQTTGGDPLDDTDADGAPDTGLLAPGASRDVVVKLVAPGTARPGDLASAALVARSSLDTGRATAGSYRAAVPSRFAQAADDGCTDRVELFIGGTLPPVHAVALRSEGGDQEPAVDATDDGFVFVRQYPYYSPGGDLYADLEYAYLDAAGAVTRAMGKLIDNSGSSSPVADRQPVVAVAPNNRAGVLWVHSVERLEPGGDWSGNQNVYFALLDADGDLLYGPASVTENTLWDSGVEDNVPSFSRPRLAATRDGRFVLAWETAHRENAGADERLSIAYAVRSADGAAVKGPTVLAADDGAPGGASYFPTTAPFDGNRALVAWVAERDGLPRVAVLDSAGSVLAGPRAIRAQATSVTYPDAVSLGSDRVALAWATNETTVGAVILDGNGEPVSDVARLHGGQSALNLSVTRDEQGRAVLTWDDGHRVWYGLLDAGGSVVLDGAPLFGCAEGGWLSAGPSGHGSAPYRRGYPCEAIDALAVVRPAGVPPNAPAVLRADAGPDWVSTPITFTWSPPPAAGQGSPVVTYTWAVTGSQLVTVTAENCGGITFTTAAISVQDAFTSYAPIAIKRRPM